MTTHPVKRRKKLIEVAIPLEAINAASAREKSIRHGHPSTLHLWWARRPLAAARAVIFCQMVDDPSAVPEEFPTEEAQENERLRLFALISELVQWENTTNEKVLNRAREEIRRSWRRCCADNADHPEAAWLFNPEVIPSFHDPFSGGGSIPLEAQRLGLRAYGSDLNPVALIVSKATYELPSQYSSHPLSTTLQEDQTSFTSLPPADDLQKKSQSLAQDVSFYGKLLNQRVSSIIQEQYKPAKESGKSVIAWLWTRTVPSPNPAFRGKHTPLLTSFLLSAKSDNPAYLQLDTSGDRIEFSVVTQQPQNLEQAKNGLKLGRGASFRCSFSGDPISPEYIRRAASSGSMQTRLTAIVCDAGRQREYLSPDLESEQIAQLAVPAWEPSLQLANDPRNFWAANYSLDTFGKIFSRRQLFALETFCEQLQLLRQEVVASGQSKFSSLQAAPDSSEETAKETEKYADSICTYLALSISRLADIHNACCVWDVGPIGSKSSTGGSARTAGVRHLFGRQTIPVAWDYAESNPIGKGGGSFLSALKWVCAAIDNLPSQYQGTAIQSDARTIGLCNDRIVSTDPPYYDNIAYADLSDFFYVWLKRCLADVYPDLFKTISTPKSDELVATPYRHGGKKQAEDFFASQMKAALTSIVESSNKAFPVTIYYAFKQAERKSQGLLSTGWEAFLQALTSSGIEILATWPIRTELGHRMIASGTNALASSVVLVCQLRQDSAPTLTRTDFRRQLRQELPQALKELERANIAPVDVAQAAIGPGMAIFSSAKAVLNPEDSPMSVREALIEINAALDEYLSQDEGELDADSRFALTFFESFGYKERDFGDAEGLAKARNLSVAGVAEAGILRSVAGKVRLLRRSELPEDWDPASDKRLCAWEATQHLIKRLEASGEGAAAELLIQLKSVSGHGDLAANCRALAYRLYNHCEKSKQAEEARSYNGLVIAWPELERQASAASLAQSVPVQTSMI
jgi:putative DNA methylase